MISTKREVVILGNLVANPEFAASAIPYIKDEYFESYEGRVIFRIIKNFHSKFSTSPNRDVIQVEVESLHDLPDQTHRGVLALIGDIFSVEKSETSWILPEAEKWAKDRALYSALMKAVDISSGENKKLSATAIPDIMSEALSVSFSSSIGHDVLEDAELRWEKLRSREVHIPFGLRALDQPTGGGIVSKTLSCVMAPTGGGKSQFMVHYAATCLRNGFNVLYISLEMSKERIAARIDANLLDKTMEEVRVMSKAAFLYNIKELSNKFPKGKIIVEEFPPASTDVSDYKRLLKDLKTREGFVPDIIFIDYINLANSCRFKSGNSKSYEIVKSVAEEFRALAVQFDCRVFTATQVNRDGMRASDFGMADTSESVGLPFTLDYYFSLHPSDTLDVFGQIEGKWLKCRDGEKPVSKFTLGLNRAKMKFYDVDDATSSRPAPHPSELQRGDTILSAKTAKTQQQSSATQKFKIRV